jgi:hypothetical protein
LKYLKGNTSKRIEEMGRKSSSIDWKPCGVSSTSALCSGWASSHGERCEE